MGYVVCPHSSMFCRYCVGALNRIFDRRIGVEGSPAEKVRWMRHQNPGIIPIARYSLAADVHVQVPDCAREMPPLLVPSVPVTDVHEPVHLDIDMEDAALFAVATSKYNPAHSRTSRLTYRYKSVSNGRSTEEEEDMSHNSGVRSQKVEPYIAVPLVVAIICFGTAQSAPLVFNPPEKTNGRRAVPSVITTRSFNRAIVTVPAVVPRS
jgi:hypothetical protein